MVSASQAAVNDVEVAACKTPKEDGSVLQDKTTSYQPAVEALRQLVEAQTVPHCSLCREGREHPVCNGTGRIPLLEGVREPCRKIHSVYYRKGLTSGGRSVNCQEAGCLGWTPTEEAWTWLVLPGSIHFSKKHYKRLAFSALKGESCFFTALEEPLRPLAINAAEAEQFVKENVK